MNRWLIMSHSLRWAIMACAIVFAHFSTMGQCPTLADLQGASDTFTLTADCEVDNSGEALINIFNDITITGPYEIRFSNGDTDLIIEAGGTFTIDAGTYLDMIQNDPNDIRVFGTFNLDGSLDMAGAEDLWISGGSVVIGSSAVANIGDDIQVYSDGSLEIETGGIVNVPGDLRTDSSPVEPVNGDGPGTVTVDGTLNVTGGVYIYNNSPDSDLNGTGSVTVGVELVYNETDGKDFSECASGGTCGGSGIPLPVELVSFEVAGTSNAVEIRWSTASETNNDYFELQRSDDGRNWFAIAQIPGATHTTSLTNYQYTDTRPALGWSYYRLRQIDLDGTSETFSAASVYFNPHSEYSITPNPAANLMTLQSEGLDHSSLSVITLSGKMVEVPVIKREANHVTYNVSKLIRGMYILRVQDGDRVTNLRFIKL